MRRGGMSGRDIAIVAVVLILGIGVVACFGFFQEEAGAYFRLEGWNLGAVKGVTKQFVEAAAKNDSAGVEKFIQDGTQDLEFIREGGKLTAIKIPAYGGPVAKRLSQLAPSADGEISEPKMVTLNGGKVNVKVKYPSGDVLDLGWDKKPAGWKVVSITLTGTGG